MLVKEVCRGSGRDDAIRPGGFTDDCAQFLVADLLMNRVIHFTHHTTRSANLDEPRALAKLPANLGETRGHCVAESEQRRCTFNCVKHLEWECMDISMTARHAEHPAGAIDMRNRYCSLRNHPSQVDTPSSNFADCRDAGMQCQFHILDASRGSDGDRLARETGPDQAASFRADEHDSPETGHYNLRFRDNGLRPRGRRRSGTGINQLRAFHNHAALLDGFAPAGDQSCSFDSDLGLPNVTYSSTPHIHLKRSHARKISLSSVPPV